MTAHTGGGSIGILRHNKRLSFSWIALLSEPTEKIRKIQKSWKGTLSDSFSPSLQATAQVFCNCCENKATTPKAMCQSQAKQNPIFGRRVKIKEAKAVQKDLSSTALSAFDPAEPFANSE